MDGSTALTDPDAYIAMQFASTALSKPLELECLETVAGFDHVFPVAE